MFIFARTLWRRITNIDNSSVYSLSYILSDSLCIYICKYTNKSQPGVIDYNTEVGKENILKICDPNVLFCDTHGEMDAH